MKKNDVFAWGFIYGCIVMLVVALLAFEVRAQTPPVSTIDPTTDTATSGSVDLLVAVQSDIPWDLGGGVGIYWTTYPSDRSTWRYAGVSFGGLFPFTFPADSLTYYFQSSVMDNAGNDEGHDFSEPKAEVYACLDCTVSPRVDILPHVQALAQAGIFSWGQPTQAVHTYTWTEARDGAPAVRYDVHLESWPTAGGDTTTFHFTVDTERAEVSYAEGYTKRLRVAGISEAGVQGPYSNWSLEYPDNNPEPGQPSIPLVFLELR